MSHTCHAAGCKALCPPEYLMCGPHWRLVPRALQRLVWQHYRPGQCDDMDFSPEWHVAARRAINAVALRQKALTEEQARAHLARVLALYPGRFPELEGVAS